MVMSLLYAIPISLHDKLILLLESDPSPSPIRSSSFTSHRSILQNSRKGRETNIGSSDPATFGLPCITKGWNADGHLLRVRLVEDVLPIRVWANNPVDGGSIW